MSREPDGQHASNEDGSEFDLSRRTFFKGLGSGLAISGVGALQASGHPAGGSHSIHRHHATENAEMVGYHSLGGFGSESTGGRPENASPDTVSEVWVEGDYAFASYLSSTENRGVAILDASDYTRAADLDDAREAELSMIATIGNETEAGTAADVKVSGDGDRLVYSKQAIGATYGETASTSTDVQDAPGAEPAGLIAYDISEPGEPKYIDSATGPNAGFHNCFIHEIGGEYHAFGVQGVGSGSAGVHIYRLTDEGLEFVNYWGAGDLRQGEYDTASTGSLAAGFYCHDFYMQDDPVTGKPVGYVAYWNYGVRVLDMSDPANLEELGFGEMSRAHYAQPAPALIDGKRVFIGGQEYSSRANQGSGYVRLFDADALFDEGSTECPELDTWELYDDVSYDGYTFSPHNADITAEGWITQAHYHAGIRFLKIQSSAESSTGRWRIAGKEIDRDDTDDRALVKTGKTHEFSGTSPADVFGNAGNVRYHEFTSKLSETGILETKLTWSPDSAANELDLYVERQLEDGTWRTVAEKQSPSGFKQLRLSVDPDTQYRYVVETDTGSAEYRIAGEFFELGALPAEEKADVEEEAIAYYRDHVEVPEEAKTDGQVSPNFWSARIENGVTFGGSRHTGLYAVATTNGVGPQVGTRTPANVDISISDDGSAFTAGQTNQIDFEIESDTDVLVRTRIPTEWSVTDGDSNTTRDVGDGIEVRFVEPVSATGAGESAPTRTLFVEAPSGTGASGSYVFGPVGYSADGGETWEPVADTTESNVVGGVDTSL